MPLSPNPFQSLVDKHASPLLTTLPNVPAKAPLPATTLPMPGGLDVGHLLTTLGTPGGRVPSADPASTQSGTPLLAKPTLPPSPDTTLRANPTGGGSWVSGVVRAARQYGVDPTLAVAIALEESGGDPRAVGDSGSSYGLFQLHKGGALGSLTPQQAFDPYRNASAVLSSWGRLGGGKGMDPRAALMQYYSRVGRGTSNEIPTQRALGRLSEARSLVGGVGGSGAGAPQGLAERTTTGSLGGGIDGKTLAALVAYSQQASAAALRGEMPDMKRLMELAGPLLAAHSSISPTTSTGAPRTPNAPILAPGSYGQPVAGQERIIGVPHQGTHTLGNWESDNAVDIAMPVGTPLYAMEDGTIGSQFGSLGSSSSRMAGLRLHLDGATDNFYYAHLSRFAPGIAPGTAVRKGQLLGWSGAANGVGHLHLASEQRDPRSYLG